jgi:hypothetical protein
LMARKLRDRFQTAGEALDVLVMISRLERDRLAAERMLDVRRAATALQDRLAIPEAAPLPPIAPRRKRARSDAHAQAHAHGHAHAAHAVHAKLHDDHAPVALPSARPRVRAGASAPLGRGTTASHRERDAEDSALGLAVTSPEHVAVIARPRLFPRGSKHGIARPRPRAHADRGSHLSLGVAALAILALGVLLGWAMLGARKRTPIQPSRCLPVGCGAAPRFPFCSLASTKPTSAVSLELHTALARSSSHEVLR